MIIIYTFILAFCSLSYELILAQSLSATLGNTVVRYSTAIGFYIMALGVGVILYNKKFNQEKCISSLLYTEQLLAVIGAFSPMIIVISNYFIRKISISLGFDDGLTSSPLYYAELFFDYMLIFIIGFLSGFELPILMDIGNKYYKKLGIKVLAFDYFGSTMGAILFALYLLPQHGLFYTGIFVGILNILTSLFIYINYRKDQKLKFSMFATSFVILIFLCSCLVFEAGIQKYIINDLYMS